MTRPARLLAALAVAAAAMTAACGGDFERMRDQPRYERYSPSTIFADGKSMQAPPAATIPIEHDDLVPTRWDMTALETGQQRYDIYCSPCHGVLGDARTPVAAHMPLRQPPSLHEPRIVALAPAQLFAVLTNGYGFMPPYASALTARERWAVVGYVRALQRSQGTPLAALPAPVQQEARAALGEGR